MLVHRGGRRRLRRSGLVSDRDPRDEPVTLPRARLQIAAAVPPVTKGPPQGGDLELQISFDDVGAGPDAGDQLFLADKLAGSLEERDQDFQRATAETNRRLAVEQEPPAGKQAEGAEREAALGRDGGRISHRNSPKQSGTQPTQ